MQTERIEHLNRLRELGHQPFLTDVTGCAYLEGFEEGRTVEFAGRILTIRRAGKMCFMTVLYSTSSDCEVLQRTQIVFQEGFTQDGWREAVKNLDIGDILHVDGTQKKTIAGEESVFVEFFSVVTKALNTIPFGQEKDGEAFNQIQDPETLIRHRHLALLTNEELRSKLIQRSRMITDVRHALIDTGFIEVQTPTLLHMPGGAEAKTFDTHYNAYDADVKLRISLEIQLKKLVCGGLDRVFEIGTVFRNEGISAHHNPEFTVLEYYAAYDNFEQGLERFLNLMDYVSRNSSIRITKNSWTISTMRSAILTHCNEDIHQWDFNDFSNLERLEKLMKTEVEPRLIAPTIITHHPVAISPLARSKDGRYAERFEAYLNGVEIANGFCEQNNPEVQLEAFNRQNQMLGTGVDHDFIYALSCGMPSCFGVGIGLDRLAMALSQTTHIRQITWFPYVKPTQE